MGDVFLNMVRNVRIFGFSCWLKICVVIIMGLCIFMATKTDAQRFRKERNMRNISPHRPDSRNFHNPQNNRPPIWNDQNNRKPAWNNQNNRQAGWNEHQRMLQELERKIQEQKRLANEIAKHQEELRRLQQNPKPNFAQRNAYSRSFSNNTGAIASPNGSHTNNNNRRNSVSNSASTINRHNFAANHFGPSFQGRNNFKNGDNLRQNSGGNFRKNNSDRKRVKLNANGNMFRNMNSQTKWSSQTSVNNNRQNNYMQVSNPQHNGFRNSLNVNGFNNLRNRNRFQNTPSKNVNNKPLVIRPVTSTNVLFQAKTINGDQNKHAVQGIPIPYNLHQVANNTENNWEKKSRTRNNKMQSNGSNTKQIVNVLNRVNEWNRNWQPQGTWQQNDKNGIKLSNSNSFQTFKQNNHTKNHHSQNTLKNAFEGSLAPAYNRAVGHEEISVFPQPEIRESLQVEDRPSNADSMTGALNSHKNSQKSISNHQNSYSGPTLWNGTTNITNNESGFNSNKPDTAIVIRYKDGKVQMGTDHFVKVETNNVAKETKSNSQTNKFGIAQKVNNAIQQPQHYSPFTIQQAATADNTEQMPFMLSRNSPAYLKNVGRTNNNRDSSLHHKSNSVPISISNRGQSQGAVNQQNHLRKVVMSTKDSGETHIPDRGRILFSQKHDTNIPNVKSQSHYPRNQIPSQGSSISEVPLSSQTQYGIENNYGTQQTIGKQKMPFHNVRLQQPQTISTNNGQDPSHFFSMQKKVGPQVVQVLPSGSHRNHQVQPQTNAQLLYSNYQKSHQPSRQQTVVSSQNGQEHSQWRQRGMGHMAAGGRISPAIVQTNPLSHDQLNQRSTGKQYRSPTNVQIPITVNRQPSVSKVSHGQYMSNEQQRLQDNLQLSVHAHNSNTDLHTRQKGALVAEAPMSVKMYSNDQDIHSTVTHTKTYSNDQPMHSVLAAQPPPLVQVVNTNGGVLSQTTKTNSHSSNDKSLGQMLTNQNNQNLQPSVSTDSGTQLHVPKNSVNTQVIQQTETLTANKSMHAESPSETKQILQTLLALLKGTNTQTTANVDLNNNAVAQPVKHVAPDNKVNGITPKQNPVVQTLQRGQDMRNVNVQNSANIPVITNPAYAQAIGNLNAVSGSNINVASHTNGHLSPAVPAFQSPFGPQMGHFGNGYPGMGNVGIGNMWGMGMQNPAAAQHMWQQLMFGGDNIDIPDPPDPPPTMMSSASTTYRAVSPPVTGTGIIGPLRLEFEGEAPFPHTTTTVATTTTTATTTTATTKTMKPKPKIKPKVVTKVKPKQIPKPDIINSIALKLAALLGKSNANGFSLGQNRLKAATKPKAKTKADGHAINNQAQTVNKIKAVPKQQSVISENAQINTNFAKSLKTSGDKVAHPQTLQLPVTFLSGKNPRQRKIAQELASTIDLNSFKPEVDPVLAGVDVKSVKAQQILAGPAIIKTDQINLKTLGTLEQFNSAHTYQPVVNVKPDSLNDITNVLTGKDTLDGIISAGASANTKSDQGAQVKIDKHHMITNIATNTVTTVSPTALNYANVAPAPSLEAEGLPKTNDGTLVIKTAVVDLLSQIKQLWMHADISTQQPTTTTTQRPCTPDSPDYSCEGIGMFAQVTTIGSWCVDKCRAGACVESVCKCSCPSPALGVAGWQGGTTESALGSLDRANTTDIPEEIEPKHFAKKTPAQRRRARKYGHLCHPLAMIHDIVCGLGPDDLKCPTGAKCMIIPRGENFCCWQDRELPGPASKKPRRRKGRRLRKKWRGRSRHKRQSTPIMSTVQPSGEEEEVELEDMVTTTAAMTTTPEFTTESPFVTSTYAYYDFIEPLTSTVSFADVKLSAYDVNKHADFKYDPSMDFALSTPGFEKGSDKYKNQISPDKIHWGSDIKGRVKETPKKKSVGPTSGYDILGVNPDTLGFVPDIERSSQWGQKKDSGTGRKSSRWNEPDGDDNMGCTCTQPKSTRPPPSWNRRNGGWRDPPARADWRDPPPRDRPPRDPPPRDRAHRDPPPRDGWKDAGRHYDRWRDPPPTTDRPWGSRWRDSPATREHGPPQDWQPRDHWASRDRGGRRGYGLRNRWRETTTKAAGEEAEGPEAPD